MRYEDIRRMQIRHCEVVTAYMDCPKWMFWKRWRLARAAAKLAAILILLMPAPAEKEARNAD